MVRRVEYALNLSDLRVEPVARPALGVSLRKVGPEDTAALVELMLEAYRE